MLGAALMLLTGCVAPTAGPSHHPAPPGLPLRRAWVVALPHRFQQTIWHAWLLMPDELVSPVVAENERLLSIEAQRVNQGFERRLRLIERDRSNGRVTRQRLLASGVPSGRESCQLIDIGGRWYVAHAPWTDAAGRRGILTAWPDATGAKVGLDEIQAGLLPPGMDKHVRDGWSFGTDGKRLLVAAVLPGRGPGDSRCWLAAAGVDVSPPRLAWRGRVQIRFPFEHDRTEVRIARAGAAAVARASLRMPHGRRRCREVFAAFHLQTGRLLWMRETPPRHRPSLLQLVADERQLYVAVDEGVIEAWRLSDGQGVWRRDVGQMAVTDACLHRGELITFVGDEVPLPAAPSMVQPIAIDVGGRMDVRRLEGQIRVLRPPSFVAVGGYVLTAPDARMVGWRRIGGGDPLTWQCWRLPGGLAAPDAVGELFQPDATTVVAYMRGTGTLTAFRVGPAL